MKNKGVPPAENRKLIIDATRVYEHDVGVPDVTEEETDEQFPILNNKVDEKVVIGSKVKPTIQLNLFNLAYFEVYMKPSIIVSCFIFMLFILITMPVEISVVISLSI